MREQAGSPGSGVLKGVLYSVLGGMAIEVVRQVGAGVREHLRDSRRIKVRHVSTPSTPSAPSPLQHALQEMGYPKERIRAVLLRPEMQDLKDRPLPEQVRAALPLLST